MVMEKVPVERVVANVEKDLRANPKDPEIHFRLGRLHSLGFANESTAKGFADEPGVGVWVEGSPKTLSKARADHLRKSIWEYEEAIRLNGNKALYHLGLAWVCQAGMPYAKQIKTRAGKPYLGSDLKAEALEHFRRAFALDIKKDQATPMTLEGPGAHLSREAAEGVKEILGAAISLEEKRRLDAEVAKIPRPTAVTPIILPLFGSGDLQSCLSATTRVHFDLVGDGLPRTWPWVRPTTGILVWDPDAKGKIRSGIQLFGSSTFWIFFEDGYQALRSLDDNRDGWLTGRELEGIAVWQDRNSNGVSDAGEVTPVKALGIEAIRATATGKTGPTLMSEGGVRWANGRLSPTYDWTPVSLPETSHRAAPRSRP